MAHSKHQLDESCAASHELNGLAVGITRVSRWYVSVPSDCNVRVLDRPGGPPGSGGSDGTPAELRGGGRRPSVRQRSELRWRSQGGRMISGVVWTASTHRPIPARVPARPYRGGRSRRRVRVLEQATQSVVASRTATGPMHSTTWPRDSDGRGGHRRGGREPCHKVGTVKCRCRKAETSYIAQSFSDVMPPSSQQISVQHMT